MLNGIENELFKNGNRRSLISGGGSDNGMVTLGQCAIRQSAPGKDNLHLISIEPVIVVVCI